MYKVKYSINGVLREITINASDAIQAQTMITNMYGGGNVQIIDIRRI